MESQPVPNIDHLLTNIGRTAASQGEVSGNTLAGGGSTLFSRLLLLPALLFPNSGCFVIHFELLIPPSTKKEVKAALLIYFPSFRFASLADLSGVFKVASHSSVSLVM